MVALRFLNIDLPAADGRRIKVTVVSPLRPDSEPGLQIANRDSISVRPSAASSEHTHNYDAPAAASWLSSGLSWAGVSVAAH